MSPPSPPPPPPPELVEALLTARTGMLVLGSVGVAVGVLLVLTEITALKIKWRQFDLIRSPQIRSALWLLGTSLSYFALNCMVLVAYSMDFSLDADLCNSVAHLMVFFYVCGKAFAYLILYERLNIVHDFMRMTNRTLRYARQVILLGSVVGMPATFFWVAFVHFKGIVFVPGVVGYCQERESELLVDIFFLIADVCISTLLLYLFIAPLYAQAKTLEKDLPLNYARLYAVAHRNMVLSCAMILSVTAMTSYRCYVINNVTDSFSNNVGTSIFTWKSFVTVLDSAVTLVVTHLMTGVWLPWRRRPQAAMIQHAGRAHSSYGAPASTEPAQEQAPTWDSNAVRAPKLAKLRLQLSKEHRPQLSMVQSSTEPPMNSTVAVESPRAE